MTDDEQLTIPDDGADGRRDWPDGIVIDNSGFTPRELGLVQKAAGVELAALSGEDQARAASFIGLFRMFPDVDPGLLWDRALDTRLRYAESDPTQTGD